MECTKTLRVFIVDDEYLIRNLLKHRICWEELGAEVVGEAAGAGEALELIGEVSPDILFTDICMPSMDGIEFSRIVIEKFPQIKIVVITGHEEFNYAQKSVKLGISDFLLKPINAEEIKRVVLNLKEKIETERSHQKNYAELKQQLEANLPYLREKFLNELLSNEMDREEALDKLWYFGFELNPATDFFQTAVVEYTSGSPGNDVVIREEEKFMLAIRSADLIRQIFREDRYIHVFFNISGKIVILSNNDKVDLPDCCEVIKTTLINQCKCFVGIGIGRRMKGFEGIRASYNEACEALDYKVVFGKNQIINYTDINFSGDSQWKIRKDKKEKLGFCITAGLKEKAAELIEEYFFDRCYHTGSAIRQMWLEAFDILSICEHTLLELKIDTADLWESHSRPYEEVSRIDNLPELKAYIIQLLFHIIERVRQASLNKANHLIGQVEDYILRNLQLADLSLASTAKEFFVSPSHLSRLFKQKTSQSFVEYITKARMDTAIKLLKGTDLKVYQIAEKVGIGDPHYFSILFKKNTGLSVQEFRKKW